MFLATAMHTGAWSELGLAFQRTKLSVRGHYNDEWFTKPFLHVAPCFVRCHARPHLTLASSLCSGGTPCAGPVQFREGAPRLNKFTITTIKKSTMTQDTVKVV